MHYGVSPTGPYTTIAQALAAVRKQIEAWQNWPVDYFVDVAPGVYRESVVMPGVCFQNSGLVQPFLDCTPGTSDVCADCRAITSAFSVPRVILDGKPSGTTSAIVDGSNAVLDGTTGGLAKPWVDTGVSTTGGSGGGHIWRLDLSQSALALARCKPQLVRGTIAGDLQLSPCNLLVVDALEGSPTRTVPTRLYAFTSYAHLAADSEPLVYTVHPLAESGSGGFFIGADPSDPTSTFNLFMVLPSSVSAAGTTPTQLVSGHRLHFGERAFGFDLGANVVGAPDVSIRNFEVRYQFSAGIGAGGMYARDNWIQSNDLHELSNGITTNLGYGGQYTVIEGNTVRGLMHPKWNVWDVKMSPTNMNNVAITTGLTMGAHTIRNNQIDYAATGVQVTSAESNPYIYGFGIDVYGNRIDHTEGNGIETDGFGVNNRFWKNTLDGALDALSAAPTAMGPVWFIGNVVTNYRAHAFKLNRAVDEASCPTMNYAAGWILAYHNTVVPAAFDAQNAIDLYPSSLSVLSTTADEGGLVFRNNILLAHHAGLGYSIGSSPSFRNLQPTTGRAPDLDFDAIWSDRTVACTTSPASVDCPKFNPHLVMWPNRQSDDRASSGTFAWNAGAGTCDLQGTSTNKDYTTDDANITPAPYDGDSVAAFMASDSTYDAATPTKTGLKYYYFRASGGPSNLGAHAYTTASHMPDPTDKARLAYTAETHGFDLAATEVSATQTANDFSALFDAQKGDSTLTSKHKLLNQAARLPGINDGATTWLGGAFWCRADLGAKKRGDGTCPLFPFPVADESLDGWTLGTYSSGSLSLATSSALATLPRYLGIADGGAIAHLASRDIDLSAFASDIAAGKLTATLTANVSVSLTSCTTGRPILDINFYNKKGQAIASATSPTGASSTAWTPLAVPSTKVPSGAVKATIRIRTSTLISHTACAGQVAGFDSVRFGVAR